MIDVNSYGNIDCVYQYASQGQKNDDAYYKKYQQYKEHISTVITTPYEVLDAYTTSKVSKNGNTIETLNLALLLTPFPPIIPEGCFIRVKLAGSTVNGEGKMVHAPSYENVCFIRLGLESNPQFLANPRDVTINGNYGEEQRTYYNNMVGHKGLVAFGTTAIYNGYNSYSALFFANMGTGLPMSDYEYINLKRSYRQGSSDYTALISILQKRINELFDVSEPQPNPVANAYFGSGAERAAAIPVSAIQPSSTVAPSQTQGVTNNDPIPF